METIMRNGNLETEEQTLSTSFHDREAAIRLWVDILDGCKVKRSVIATELGMSEGYFSKVSAGLQGDLLGLVLQVGRKYPKLRSAFINGLAEIENTDPLTQAAEHLAAAAIRFVRLQAERLPLRMAHAELPADRKRGVA